jgi:hypothetical protein
MVEAERDFRSYRYNVWIWAEANFNDIQNSIRGRRFGECETLITLEHSLQSNFQSLIQSFRSRCCVTSEAALLVVAWWMHVYK